MVHIKVGKSVNLVKRLDEWTKQCGKHPVLRGYWPTAGGNDSLLSGCTVPGTPGPLMGRLERLVHLELADLALAAPYLEGGAAPAKTKARVLARPRVVCKCGRVHQEIFSFTRAKRGQYKDAVWEELVWPVIRRWGLFVEQFVAPTTPDA